MTSRKTRKKCPTGTRRSKTGKTCRKVKKKPKKRIIRKSSLRKYFR